MTLVVNEMFLSIQGESTYVGLPCAFVRLTGCNLRCSYCDTTYAFEEGTPMSLESILDSVRKTGVALVALTGGEPLLQPHLPNLAAMLLEAGHTVLVESNGSLDISRLPEKTVCILDMKCPGSGMCNRMDLHNLDLLRPQDELKFVLCDRNDYEWAKNQVKTWGNSGLGKILFSPALPVLPPRHLAEWILQDRLPVRFQYPLHRILWPDTARGT
jgi:7-carboxy-7-deazaguanine synthase